MVSKAYAVAMAQSSCDSQVMDALEAKAWLHAQRRITQNKNLILKPDSVLEYSCFNQYLGYVAAGPGRRFSESTYWGSVIGNDSASLDRALQEVVYTPLVDYLQNNYMHTFLGGRMLAAGGAPPSWGTYNCTAMRQIWRVARCRNFIDAAEEGRGAEDGFYDFSWYALNDPRNFPTTLASCSVDNRVDDALVESYRGRGQDGASGNEWSRFVLATENDPAPTIIGTNTTLYEEDLIESSDEFHLDYMLPGAPSDCNDSAQIPTGVTVERRDVPITYDEHVCSRPACSYDGSDCVP